MNEQDLYNGITHVKGRYIQEAATTKVQKRKLPIAIVSLAACLCLVIASSFFWISPTKSQEESDKEEPSPTFKHSATVNLLANVTTNPATPLPATDETLLGTTKDIANFSMELLRQEYTEDNLVISPLSIVSALTMAGNGASGDTKAQMEQVLGREIPIMNQYLYSYRTWLPSTNNCTVSTANSIWYRDTENLTMVPEFLQINQDFHNGELYQAPFDDQTVADINQWVSQETEGEIQEILQGPMDEDAMIYLINALSFDGEWRDMYEDHQIKDGIFTCQNGTEETAKFMSNDEYGYLNLEGASGFVKDYAGGEYAFVGILPDGNLDEYLATLQGATLVDALWNQEHTEVSVTLPQFSTTSDMELSAALQTMGMGDAFTPEQADFTAMASAIEGNLYIGEAVHETTITVDQRGTKAGAVTLIESEAAEAPAEEEPKIITLDRPFLFLIVDNTVHLPVFLGAIHSVS